MTVFSSMPQSVGRCGLTLGLAFAAAAVGAGGVAHPLHARQAVVWEVSRDVDAGSGQSSDGGLITAADHVGNVYVVAASPLFAGGEDAVVIKYDAAGKELWMKVYGGEDELRMPVDAVVDAQGNLCIASQATTEPGSQTVEWCTFKVAAGDGHVMWERRFFGSGTFGYAIPRDMVQAANGDIVVAGWSRSDDTFGDFGVVKYDPNGVELWSDEFSSPGFESDVAEGVAIAADGSVAVVGVYVQGGDRVIGTVKYNAAGVFQWSRTFDASSVAGLEDRAQSVTFDGAGNVYVAGDGINNFTDGRDFVLLKYDAAGVLEWDRRIVQPTPDIYPVVMMGPNGNVFMSGQVSNTGQRMAAFSPSGQQLWTVHVPGTITDQSRLRHAMFDAFGRLTVLQRTVYEPGITAYTISRYTPAGNLVGSLSIDPEGVSRWPTALATDDAGRAYATGWWIPNGHRDVLTYSVSLPETGDINGDGFVDIDDLLGVIGAWGDCAPVPQACPGDVGPNGGDGTVNVDDLLHVISQWS